MKKFNYTDYLESLIGRKIKVWQRTPTHAFSDGCDCGILLAYDAPYIYLREDDAAVIALDLHCDCTSIKLVLELVEEDKS